MNRLGFIRRLAAGLMCAPMVWDALTWNGPEVREPVVMAKRETEFVTEPPDGGATNWDLFSLVNGRAPTGEYGPRPLTTRTEPEYP